MTFLRNPLIFRVAGASLGSGTSSLGDRVDVERPRQPVTYQVDTIANRDARARSRALSIQPDVAASDSGRRLAARLEETTMKQPTIDAQRISHGSDMPQ